MPRIGLSRMLGGVLLVLLAGCGSGGNVVALTPVQADTRGSYRLVASETRVTPTSGASSFASFSSGTLKLDDPGYTRTVTDHGPKISRGAYRLGSSVNTILNNRHGNFSLTSTDPPFLFTGSYDVTADFLLTLNYDQFVLPDQGLIARSETWLKVSD